MIPDRSRPAADTRASPKMQLAAAMLLRGDDLPTIAVLAGVPVPLLELLLEEQRTPPRRRPRLGGPAVTLRLMVTLVVVDFLTFCSLTVSVTAVLLRQTNIAISTAVAAAALRGASNLLIRRGRRH